MKKTEHKYRLIVFILLLIISLACLYFYKNRLVIKPGYSCTDGNNPQYLASSNNHEGPDYVIKIIASINSNIYLAGEIKNGDTHGSTWLYKYDSKDKVYSKIVKIRESNGGGSIDDSYEMLPILGTDNFFVYSKIDLYDEIPGAWIYNPQTGTTHNIKFPLQFLKNSLMVEHPEGGTEYFYANELSGIMKNGQIAFLDGIKKVWLFDSVRFSWRIADASETANTYCPKSFEIDHEYFLDKNGKVATPTCLNSGDRVGQYDTWYSFDPMIPKRRHILTIGNVDTSKELDLNKLFSDPLDSSHWASIDKLTVKKDDVFIYTWIGLIRLNTKKNYIQHLTTRECFMSDSLIESNNLWVITRGRNLIRLPL